MSTKLSKIKHCAFSTLLAAPSAAHPYHTLSLRALLKGTNGLGFFAALLASSYCS